jgi:hypothetical protein
MQPNEDKESMTKEKESKPEDPLKSQVHETMRPTSDSYAHGKEQKTLISKHISRPRIKHVQAKSKEVEILVPMYYTNPSYPRRDSKATVLVIHHLKQTLRIKQTNLRKSKETSTDENLNINLEKAKKPQWMKT